LPIIALSFTGDKTLVLQKLYTSKVSFVKNVTFYMALFFLWGNDEGISSINCREIKIYRRNHFSDMRTKTENIILESRLLEEWYRNAGSGLRILFILGKTTDC